MKDFESMFVFFFDICILFIPTHHTFDLLRIELKDLLIPFLLFRCPIISALLLFGLIIIAYGPYSLDDNLEFVYQHFCVSFENLILWIIWAIS